MNITNIFFMWDTLVNRLADYLATREADIRRQVADIDRNEHACGKFPL